MRNLKRFLAMGLAATMVFGSSLTVFADDGTSETSTGTGKIEGHVEKHVISVTLPTVPDGLTPFNYTVDPERLVEATNGAAYENLTFTEEAKAAGVYFLTKTEATEEQWLEVDTSVVTVPDSNTTYYIKNVFNAYTAQTNLDEWEADTTYYTHVEATAGGTGYDNKSDTYEVESQSSDDVELTVSVAAAEGANITLLEEAPDADEETESAQLYLALMVGDEATPIVAGKTVSKKVTIKGVDGNFEETYDSDSQVYKYTVKETLSSDWNTASFYLTGAASNADAKSVTVPTLTVTWSYAEKTSKLDAETISSTSNSVTVADGYKVTAVTLVKPDGTTTVNVTGYTFSNQVLTITNTSMLGNTANIGGSLKITLQETSSGDESTEVLEIVE